MVDSFESEPELPPESLAFTEDGQWIIGDDHGSGAIFFGSVSGGPTIESTIFAPNGGSYYTSTSNFASTPLAQVLGTSTEISFSTQSLTVPNTGLSKSFYSTQ